MKPNILNRFRISQLLAAACITSSAYAATGTWNGSTSNDWQTSANWSASPFPGVAADSYTTTEEATFSTTGSGTINLGGVINIRNINFGVTTGNAAAFIIGDADDTLNLTTAGTTLMGTGVTVTEQIGVAGTTIKLSTTASSTYAFTNNSTTPAAKLDIAGNITTSAASGISVLTLGGTNGGTVSGNITNGGTANLALTKSGAGTWTLTAANGYTGTTTIAGGILALSGGNDRLATTGTVNFSAASTLALGSTEQTLANMTVGNTITGTVTGTTGSKLTLTGSLFALGTGTGNNQTATLNLSGLPTFAYNNAAGTFRVSGDRNTAGQNGGHGVLTLASGTNTITALNYGLGNINNSNNSGANTGTMNLGTTNTINAGTITIGGNRGAGTLQYLSGNNTSLTLRGSDTTSRVTSMILSDHGGPNTSGVGAFGTVDLTTNVTGTSTLNAMITTLTIGKNARGADAGGNTIINTGTFTMGTGTLDATTIILAQNTAGFTNGGSTSKTTGNLTVNGGTIKVGTFYFADQNTTSTTASALEANFNLNGGANLYAATIAKGLGTGTTARGTTRTFNWNNGTVHNFDSSTDLTIDSNITWKLADAAAGTRTFDIDTNRTATVNAVLANATTLGTLAKAGNGTLTLNGSSTYDGGTTVNAGTLALGHATNTLANTGAVTVDGNTAILSIGGNSDTVGAVSLKNAGSITGSGGILTGSSYAVESGSVSAKLGGTGATLTKTTGGTVTLSGVNSYTGATTVSAGTLLINGEISTSVLTTVNGTGIIGGSGTVGALTVSSGGTLSPGNSIDTLDIAGNLTLSEGSFSVFEINAALDSTDLAIASALLAFDGTLTVTNLAGTLADGDSFDLFNWNTTSGSFDSVILPGLDSGLAWDTSELYNDGTIAVTVIPEPAAALLGSLGMLALLRRRRN
jgi:autotransporter-associated beta strand protein